MYCTACLAHTQYMYILKVYMNHDSLQFNTIYFKGNLEYWLLVENFTRVLALWFISSWQYILHLHCSMEKIHLNCTENV